MRPRLSYTEKRLDRHRRRVASKAQKHHACLLGALAEKCGGGGPPALSVPELDVGGRPAKPNREQISDRWRVAKKQ